MTSNQAMRKAAGYLLALAAGAGGAGLFSTLLRDAGEARKPEQPVASPMPGRQSTRPDKSPSSTPAGSPHRQAWELILRQPPSDRDSLMAALLKEWIEVDPAGALEAVLADEESAQWLELFSGVFDKDPAGFRDLFADERFGLGTAKVRDWWIDRMALKKRLDEIGDSARAPA
jgi:hypothetical protein